MDAIIQSKNISFSYSEKVILKDISFSVKKNDFIGIIGPNGAGKTTLLKIILGVLKPTSGSIEIFGKSPEKARKYIGYVPQYAEFERDFPISVMDTVLMGRLNEKKIFYNKEDYNEAINALKLVSMEEYRGKKIGNLSGGQLQRVLIARALCKNPEILILDEPTASVDNKVESDIYNLLRDLNRKMTIILVSHDVGFISSYVKRIFCLNKTLCVHDTPDVTVNHNHPHAYNDSTKQIIHRCGL